MNDGRLSADNCPIQLEWAVATRAKHAGANGDGYALLREGTRILAAVIDGVGSGAAAHAATTASIRALGDPALRSVGDRFAAVHTALGGGRGAAMAIAEIELGQASLTWAAVGDIDGVLWHRDGSAVSLVQKGGTLGISYAGFHASSTQLAPGDVIVMTSDGIARGYRKAARCDTCPGALAATILETHGRCNDDCIVFAMRVVAS